MEISKIINDIDKIIKHPKQLLAVGGLVAGGFVVASTLTGCDQSPGSGCGDGGTVEAVSSTTTRCLPAGTTPSLSYEDISNPWMAGKQPTTGSVDQQPATADND